MATLPKPARVCLLLVAILGVLWSALLRLDPPPAPYEPKPASPQVFARDGSLLRAFTSSDEKWRMRAHLAGGSRSRGRQAGVPYGNRISTHLVTAVLQHEDRWFFRHPGINPVALVRAAWTNTARRRVVCGASTITMQLARLTHPEERSLHYKLWQMYRALQYECLLSKEEILEAYLNVAPYGGNIEGVEAASWFYFGKSSSQLSVGESALLAVIPQSPSRHHPLRHPDIAKAARDRLIARLAKRGCIDAATAAEAVQLPLPAAKQALPFEAPHFTDWVRCDTGAPRESGIYVTTLDAQLQKNADAAVERHVASLEPLGITQGAAVILDYEASELLALVGSADWFDRGHSGQVNGARSARSPGSTLKPFVYALAMDRGLITPETRIEDIPMHLGAYEPQNFDGEYRGVITAAEALRNSRNVPAVRLAHQLARSGGRDLYDLLQEAGVRSLRQPRDHYGLSLVLGGGEVSLLELTDLYACLARHGRKIDTTFLRAPSDKLADKIVESQLFSAEAASLVLGILTDVRRPELDAVWRSGRRMHPVAWKTGTSYGRRDAWSIGIVGRYVVGVWVGNFDGSGVPALVGTEVAAPLLFELVAGLPHDHAGRWQQPIARLEMRRVCATSGMPYGPHCPHTVWDRWIPGVSPAIPCDIHREILIDTQTGLAVCSRCLDSRRTVRRVVECWPNPVAQYLRTSRLHETAIPPHNPKCYTLESGSPPRITQPAENTVYYLRPGVPLEDQRIRLDAAVSGSTHEVFWFIDGMLVWKGPPDRPVFIDARAGVHEACIKDDRGRSARHVFHVEIL